MRFNLFQKFGFLPNRGSDPRFWGLWNDTKKWFVLLLFFIVIGGVLIPEQAHAQLFGIFKAVNEGVASLFANIFLLLANLVGQLLSVVIYVLVQVVQYNGFISSPAVSKGWIIIRDLFNMFFVVILLVIAFSAVLKIEKYPYKRMLSAFLIAAVLVNFSKLISGVLIDFSQILMLTFVNAFKDVAGGNFVEMLGLKEIMSLSANVGAEVITPWKTAITIMLGFIMALVALVVMIVVTLIFVFRIVGLWFLVVLSPLAFMAMVLPSTQSYGRQWWQKFTNYLIVGPVLAFFIWLSLAVVQEPGGRQLLPATESIGGEFSVGVSQIGQPQYMLNFIIGIAMLIASLMVAKQLGVAGAGLATQAVGKLQGVATGAIKLPFKGMKFGAKEMVKTAEAGIGIPLTKERWQQAWQTRRTKVKEKREEKWARRRMPGLPAGYEEWGDVMSLKGLASFPKHIIQGFTGKAQRLRKDAEGKEDVYDKIGQGIKAKSSREDRDKLDKDIDETTQDIITAKRDSKDFGARGTMTFSHFDDFSKTLIQERDLLRESKEAKDQKRAKELDDLIKSLKIGRGRAKKAGQREVGASNLISDRDLYKNEASKWYTKQMQTKESHLNNLTEKKKNTEFSEGDQSEIKKNLQVLQAEIQEFDIDDTAKTGLLDNVNSALKNVSVPLDELTPEARKEMADAMWDVQQKIQQLRDEEEIGMPEAETPLEQIQDSHFRLSKDVIADEDMKKLKEDQEKRRQEILGLRAQAEMISPTTMTPDQREAINRGTYREYEKLKGIDSAPELMTLYARAEKEKNANLARAVITKLNDQFDINELLEVYDLEQGWKGMADLADRLKENFDIPEQQAYSFMNDIGATNKLRGNFKFVMPFKKDQKTGRLEKVTQKQHEEFAYIESGKIAAQQLWGRGSWGGVFAKHKDPVTGQRVPIYDDLVGKMFKRAMGTIEYEGVHRNRLLPEITAGLSHPNVMGGLKGLRPGLAPADRQRLDNILSWLEGQQGSYWGREGGEKIEPVMSSE
ncbi:hypothetical protein MYX07_00505 [Patescibacteria group bacterium AH-259-L07]|nr:hypothetical protein [Patescibacteria group bacterium AH-259-L07]